jgi:hypothetical protein
VARWVRSGMLIGVLALWYAILSTPTFTRAENLMAKGKATGVNREYQKLAHDIVQQLEGKVWVPYSDDGVDIAFPLFGTMVTFDAVLKAARGDLIVIECKRYADRYIEQHDIFALWAEIECLHRTLNVPVQGIFVTKHKYRIGAIKVAHALNIQLTECAQDQSTSNYVINYLKYDPEPGKTPQERKNIRSERKSTGRDPNLIHNYKVGLGVASKSTTSQPDLEVN